jgi:hypothetical protein
MEKVMAKVNIEFDTSTKEMTVSMDGKALPNVMSVGIYKGYGMDGGDDYSCSIMTKEDYTDDGYQSYQQIVARNSGMAKKMIEEGATSFSNPDFVIKKTNNLIQSALKKLFKRA